MSEILFKTFLKHIFKIYVKKSYISYCGLKLYTVKNYI